MGFAKFAMWAGGVIALLGTNIPSGFFHSIGLRPFLDSEVSHFAITLGLCILTGGVVAYGYEREKNSN
jgi:hypothetical protein